MYPKVLYLWYLFLSLSSPRRLQRRGSSTRIAGATAASPPTGCLPPLTPQPARKVAVCTPWAGGWVTTTTSAAFEAAKEAVYLRRLQSELGEIAPTACIPLHEDSQACIKIATNPCLAERTKHFDIKYHWLRNQVQNKAVELKYISTHDQIADLLTKSLGPRQHAKLRTLMTGM